MAVEVSSSNNDNFEQDLQSYLQHMNEELDAAELLIEAMQNDQAAEKPYQEQLSWLIGAAKCVWPTNNPGPTTVSEILKHISTAEYNEYKDAQAHIASLEGDIKTKQQALKAIDPNINLNLINQLNQMLAQSDSLSYDDLDLADSMKAREQITQIFTQLCDVLMDTIRADLAQAGMKQFGQSSDPRASAAILQFAGIAMQAEIQEQCSLQNVQTDVINDLIGWNQEKSSAQADSKTSHWYDFFTGGGPDTAKDGAEIRAADAMISILTEVERAISPLISVVDPGMQEFKIELDELKKKVQTLIAKGGSLREIQDAMVEALSILVGIIAETTKDASMYDKEMNQGALANSQIQINDSLAQEEVVEDAKKYAAIMGKLLTAAKYIGMALIFLVNPGVAMAVMIAIEQALDAAGVMNKLQNALSDKLGDTGGAAMMCAIEVIGTAGGAAAIEAVMAQAAKAAVEAAEKVIEKTVQTVVERTTQSAQAIANKVGEAAASAARANGALEEEAMQIGSDASAKSMAAARTVAEKTVNLAVETAEKKLAFVYMGKTVPELIAAMMKGNLKQIMETAIKEAVENTGKSEELEMLVQTAAKQGSADVIGEEEIASVARKAADDAVSQAAQVSKESVSKIDRMTIYEKDLGEKTANTKAFKRAAWSGLAAMGSTGLITDLVALGQGKDKKDLSEGWQTALEIIQALVQLMGMLGQTDIGMQSIIASAASAGGINKFLSGASAISSGSEVIGEIGTAEADFEQAGAVKAIAKDQSILDMMQFIMSQLKKEGSLIRDQYAKEMQQISKTNLELAMHFNDSNQEIAQTLAVSPV